MQMAAEVSNLCIISMYGPLKVDISGQGYKDLFGLSGPHDQDGRNAHI